MWYLEYPKDSTPAFDMLYKKVLNMAFIKKLASFRRLDVAITKGKGPY